MIAAQYLRARRRPQRGPMLAYVSARLVDLRTFRPTLRRPPVCVCTHQCACGKGIGIMWHGAVADWRVFLALLVRGRTSRRTQHGVASYPAGDGDTTREQT